MLDTSWLGLFHLQAKKEMSPPHFELDSMKRHTMWMYLTTTNTSIFHENPEISILTFYNFKIEKGKHRFVINTMNDFEDIGKDFCDLKKQEKTEKIVIQFVPLQFFTSKKDSI